MVNDFALQPVCFLLVDARNPHSLFVIIFSSFLYTKHATYRCLFQIILLDSY